MYLGNQGVGGNLRAVNEALFPVLKQGRGRPRLGKALRRGGVACPARARAGGRVNERWLWMPVLRDRHCETARGDLHRERDEERIPPRRDRGYRRCIATCIPLARI
jgi:hypothetical protein